MEGLQQNAINSGVINSFKNGLKHTRKVSMCMDYTVPLALGLTSRAAANE